MEPCSESCMSQTVQNPIRESKYRELVHELAKEAEQFRFEVAPNPCVGAAVLAGDRVIARGFHESWGGIHAEPAALKAAAESGVPRAEWDTLVITLEPCSTVGKTTACTEVILESGISNVIVSELDPDERHRGAGLAILERAGLNVSVLTGGSRLREYSPHFIQWNSFERIRRPRPWVIAKWAQTRSGQLTPPEHIGGGRWISSEASRSDVQVLRSRVDAIVTGIGTVRSDDPRMTLRSPADLETPPARIVMDTDLMTPTDAKILQPVSTHDECGGPTWIVCRSGADSKRHRALVKAGAQIHGIKGDSEGQVSLRGTLDWLWHRGARRVLLESGTTLLNSFLEQRFVDQLRIYTGEVSGGHGASMADWLDPYRLQSRLDRECGTDHVLESFVRVHG
ncbi:MAG: diaminohydroxyphosphoribosylaminopyrimidine deaminase [Planctomycetota bacterium]|jgi:diaminohydroxyphosphoribosylaminopyrimidine deaminase/5-amino-6-(5-phosphoribosylamino)uracil reductase